MILYDREKGWVPQDLASVGGVTLNQHQIRKEAALKSGDLVLIGSTVIFVRDLRQGSLP